MFFVDFNAMISRKAWTGDIISPFFGKRPMFTWRFSPPPRGREGTFDVGKML